MRTPRPGVPVLCTLLLAFFAADLRAQRPDRRERRESAPVELTCFEARQVSIDTPSLKSGSLDCMVYLPKPAADAATGGDEETAGAKPASTETTTALPWVIWLHGLNDGYTRFHQDGGAATLDKLRAAGELPAMIVVVPTVARQTLYLDGENIGDVETAITTDVVAYVEKTWPVAKDPNQRAVMGVSMGGFGALKIAMRHPDVFTIVAAHASAILPADPAELSSQHDRYRGRMAQQLGITAAFGDPIDAERWAEQMPLGLVRDRDAAAFAPLRIYFDVGTEDRYGFGPPNEELHQAMQAKGIAHTFRLVEGGGHSWGSPSMVENLAHSLKFVGAAFATPPAAKADDDGEPAAAPTPAPPASGGR